MSSGNTNIESRFEIQAVFPDSEEPERDNAGLASQDTLRQSVLEELQTNAGSQDAADGQVGQAQLNATVALEATVRKE